VVGVATVIFEQQIHSKDLGDAAGLMEHWENYANRGRCFKEL
jgi:hypothetical protein